MPADPVTVRTEPRRRIGLRALLVAAFLGSQVVIPLVQLPKPRPARFGWQMFAGMPNHPRFTLIGRDGSRRTVDQNQYIGNYRGDLDLAAALPLHLCAQLADVDAVEVSGVGRERRVWPCR